MNVAQRANEQLASWPELTRVPSGCGSGSALRAGDHDIVHFHSDRDADLHLTPGPIARLHAELEQSTAVRLHPESPWVTVHLDCDSDADLLVALVSIALQAHANVPAGPAEPAPCNLARVEILTSAQLAPAAPVLRLHQGRRLHLPHRRTA
ncbi:luciferase domain-containing protein [Streptacidiphilus cavernicola]|uniref:Luciferase family protein n=1 Tax=Streptacidiphilus cavernicola TaxID=3342716 RepID=A0ABV6VRD3_9ACTN